MSNVIAFVRDSLTSLVSRMGTDRDKAATTFYTHTVLSDEQLIAAYSTAWLPRKIVDIPALDACRKWRDWQAKKPQIEAIEEEEKRLNVKGKILEAAKKGRLFGGAAVYIGTGDADPSQPLYVERVKKGGIRYLNVITRRNLTAGEIDRNPESEWYGRPAFYNLTGANSLQVRIHPSRLVLFTGAMPADDEITGNPWQGWGDSVLQSTLDAIKNADSTAGNIASLVFEAKIDIIRVPDFMANLNNEVYRSKILERYTLANMSKGINGTLLLDKEEEYESKSAQLGGLTDILMAFMQIVSGAADIPVTRLLGQSPAGMNATGTSDMKNYHDRIQSMQELEMQPAMRRLDECIERSAGVVDPDVYYRWAPLEQMSEKERAEIFKTTADAARQLVGTGTGQEIVPREAVSDALVNRLVEDGVLPGLDAAIEKYGSLEEQEPSEEELAAAAAAQATKTEQPTRMQRAANDAAPRTLYVRRDVLNRADIVKWATEQGFTDIVPDLHVTITYSRAPVDWFEMGESWSPRLEISAGGPRQMEALGQDGSYKALLITANELKWRHEAMVEMGASWDWPEYQPHITIQVGGDIDLSQVTPYQGKIVLGPEIFEELRDA
ncbi:anti-CBASS protein Acb1 family protein [Rhizobium phaseoli]|uniref:anti-CBASS protein Acb1 family protein n=1 Tax=Rhizobium phaseoli TaxID=396 RepID=UPI0002F879BC|nr:anti-CBASS Acb1 family protein [Rhizobium phaseoli]KKZ89054.1 phage-related protein [Rhizobium phaseoli Ch24-10]